MPKYSNRFFLFCIFVKYLIKLTFMTTAAIRAKLADYIQIADEKKLKAIYVMVEDEIIDAEPINYTPALRSKFDRRVAHYLEGGKMVTPTDMSKRLQNIRKKRN